MGYHACKYNVLYEMEYCDPGGLNLPVPPENLHTVLLGLYVQQLQGFARVKQLVNKGYYVFTESYLEEIERDLKQVGFQLSQQSDPELPKTYLESGYIPGPRNTSDGTTGKKAGHEMRGVILTLLVYLLKQQLTEGKKKE